MVSRTKFLIDEKTIHKMFEQAGINNIVKIRPLGNGEFNAVYEVVANRDYVLKIAPKTDFPVLTYEKNMIKSEVYWYDMISKKTDIKVPEVYYTDFSKKLIPADWFIMEKLEGKQRNQIKIDKDTITKETANMIARIHKIHNNKFGYIQNELFDNWYDALKSMIENLIQDAQRMGKKTKNGKRLSAYADKYKDILLNVPCCMVNYDLWDPNVLCTFDKKGKIEFSWIDPERSFWGDRIFDFVCLENPIDFINNKTDSIQHYNAAAECPVEINMETEIRFAFAIGLLALIQEVEKYYRYTPRHFGWWRNVYGHMIYYKSAFKVLRNTQNN